MKIYKVVWSVTFSFYAEYNEDQENKFEFTIDYNEKPETKDLKSSTWIMGEIQKHLPNGFCLCDELDMVEIVSVIDRRIRIYNDEKI